MNSSRPIWASCESMNSSRPIWDYSEPIKAKLRLMLTHLGQLRTHVVASRPIWSFSRQIKAIWESCEPFKTNLRLCPSRPIWGFSKQIRAYLWLLCTLANQIQGKSKLMLTYLGQFETFLDKSRSIWDSWETRKANSRHFLILDSWNQQGKFDTLEPQGSCLTPVNPLWRVWDFSELIKAKLKLLEVHVWLILTHQCAF